MQWSSACSIRLVKTKMSSRKGLASISGHSHISAWFDHSWVDIEPHKDHCVSARENSLTPLTNQVERRLREQTFTRDDAFNMIYLLLPRMFSVHITSHETLLSCRTSFQRWPSGGLGICASRPMLIMTSSGRMRFFTQPIFGCSPRPRKRPGGSIL